MIPICQIGLDDSDLRGDITKILSFVTVEAISQKF